MLKKIDIKFLINSVHYFRDYRHKNLKVFNNFYLRLDDFFDHSKQGQKLSKSSALLFKKLIAPVSLVLRQVFRLPHYIAQTLSLRRSQYEYIKSCEAFGVASSRLDLDGSEGVALQLERMTEVIGGGDVLNLFSEHEQLQKTIVIYDPQLESGFWRRNRTSHNEKLFIFDGAYIIFLSLVILFTGVFFRGAEEFIFLRHYLKQSKASKGGQATRLHVRVAEALTFISYHNIISRLPKHSTKLLTSNSFFVELLRAYILQNKSSGKIIEILHGTIGDTTRVWFERLMSSQDKIEEKKHLLIPLVPCPPELETFKKKYFLGKNNTSINAYLNTYLYKNKKLHGSYKVFALNYLNQLSLDPDDKGLTLTVYGGTSIEGSFFHSSAFKTETKVLDKIIDYFLKKKINIKIIYTPHPANKLLPLKVADIFKKRNVKVLEHSVFTYFITDYCISNLSSCLFELNWLGAKCFSPLIESDGIYSKDYLKTIYHPKEDGVDALENGLYRCLNAGLDSCDKSYIEKFNIRLKMVKGENFN
jgi:hypothetical protein